VFYSLRPCRVKHRRHKREYVSAISNRGFDQIPKSTRSSEQTIKWIRSYR